MVYKVVKIGDNYMVGLFVNNTLLNTTGKKYKTKNGAEKALKKERSR